VIDSKNTTILNSSELKSDGYSALFFCRTPLQAMIAMRLMGKGRSPNFVVYYANSDSDKHLFYFNQISAARKIFITWRPIKVSDTLTDLVAYWRLPSQFRKRKYTELYGASIGSIPFSLMLRDNPDAVVKTFDDGTLNVNLNEFQDWIFNEPLNRRILKSIFRCVHNPELLTRIKQHYTIFPKQFVKGIPCNIEELDLLPKCIATTTIQHGSKLRILIGTGYSIDDPRQMCRTAIIDSGRFDLFLPHHADYVHVPVACERVLSIIPLKEMNELIAEHVIKKLIEAGERLVIYGFDSTCLLNIARQVRVATIIFEGYDGTFSDNVREHFRIKQLRFANGLTQRTLTSDLFQDVV